VWGAAKHVVKLIRMRGFIPLREGVEVRPCRSLINRVNRDASSFEVDLSKANVADHPKARYTFICHNLTEANEWQRAIKRQIPYYAAPSSAFAASTSSEPIDTHAIAPLTSETF